MSARLLVLILALLSGCASAVPSTTLVNVPVVTKCTAHASAHPKPEDCYSDALKKHQIDPLLNCLVSWRSGELAYRGDVEAALKACSK